jgi:hypothetical protein
MLVRFTDNFLANLNSVENYWLEAGCPGNYDRLLEFLRAVGQINEAQSDAC